jgi:hypothetical protein
MSNVGGILFSFFFVNLQFSLCLVHPAHPTSTTVSHRHQETRRRKQAADNMFLAAQFESFMGFRIFNYGPFAAASDNDT